MPAVSGTTNLHEFAEQAGHRLVRRAGECLHGLPTALAVSVAGKTEYTYLKGPSLGNLLPVLS